MELFTNDYLVLYQKIKELSELCLKIETELSDMIDMASNLDIFWDGDANSRLITSFNEDITFVETVVYKQRECVRLLDDALKDYQENEKVIAKIIGGLKL